VDVPRSALLAAAVVVGLLLGPWLARASVRLAGADGGGRPSPARTVLTTAVLPLLLAGAAAVTGPRPALLALGWAAGAAVVLGAVDLAVHRIPDRVTYPAAVVCTAALVVDAAVTGAWDALVRALLAAVASGGVAALGWLAVPAGLGLGDVKLLALLGLVLGWLGWGVLLAGVFLGLVVGSVVAVVALATRRAGLRTALPFGPPLLTGAALAVALDLVGTFG
jgi:leader peptidase (prepilin peptidase) / N-methyltransferase